MHLKRNIALLLVLVIGESTAAWAHDIQCATTQQPGERVICDHAILNNQYDDIFAQQQALLGSGQISPAQLATWRAARNACIDVHCIDGVFAQWKTVAQSAATLPSAGAVPGASSVITAPIATASEPEVPASGAAGTSEASLVQQGSAAGIALPKPVDPAASGASAPAAPTMSFAASDTRGTNVVGGAASVGLVALIALLAVIGVVFIRRRNRK